MRHRDLFIHLPVLLITTMLAIAVLLELTVIPPLAFWVKLPLAMLLGLYLLAPRTLVEPRRGGDA